MRLNLRAIFLLFGSCLLMTSTQFGRANNLSEAYAFLSRGNLKQAAEIADQIYRTVGHKDTSVIGIGRSPTIFIEFLRMKHDMDVGFLPISGIKSLSKNQIYNGLSEIEQNNLDFYFDQLIPAMARGKKRLVFIDCSGTGLSIRFMARELTRYAVQKGLDVEIIVGSIESPAFHTFMNPNSAYFKVYSKDRVRTSFKIHSGEESSNLLTAIAFGGFDWFSPFKRYSIRKIISEGHQLGRNPLVKDQTLYRELQSIISIHTRKYPFLSPLSSHPATIVRPQNVGWFRRAKTKCQSLFDKILIKRKLSSEKLH
jgi:hypothetical protein